MPLSTMEAAFVNAVTLKCHFDGFYRKECNGRKDRKGDCFSEYRGCTVFLNVFLLKKKNSNLLQILNFFLFLMKYTTGTLSTKLVPFAIFATFAFFAIKLFTQDCTATVLTKIVRFRRT